MAKKKRTPATELVANATSMSSRGVKWTEQITPEEQAYISSVVAVMKDLPGAAPYVVAKKLKDELKLSVCVGTIAKTLKELVNNG